VVAPEEGKPFPGIDRAGGGEAHPEDTALVRREADSLRLPPLTAPRQRPWRVGGHRYGPTHDLQTRPGTDTSGAAAAPAARPARTPAKSASTASRSATPSPRSGFPSGCSSDARLHRSGARPLEEGCCLPAPGYVERAAVCVVQVGATGGESRGVRRRAGCAACGPAVAVALEAQPGRRPRSLTVAVAGETIPSRPPPRTQCLTEVNFVVLTDGRGNVPLAASLSGMKPARVAARVSPTP